LRSGGTSTPSSNLNHRIPSSSGHPSTAGSTNITKKKIDQFNPALLPDVGLKRIGNIVVEAEPSDCANEDYADIFTNRRTA
jgi:hypothetical protein